MLIHQTFNSLTDLYHHLNNLDKKSIYFLGEFLREVDKDNDELLILLEQGKDTLILTSIHSNQQSLTSLINHFYIAYLFENEIYDNYGKITDGIDNYILRYHLFDKAYFPQRKLGKPMISEKKPYIFTNIVGKDLVEVPVGPIHAGIIPPGHFRFTVDGEDTLNLDIQLGWKHRGIENYFTTENNLSKLLLASQEIAGDSAVAYAWGFVRNIEQAMNLQLDDQTIINRIILLELERIYNHLWTVGALANDVGQCFLLNSCLDLRENILDLNDKLYGNRILKNIINIGSNNFNIKKEDIGYILSILEKISRGFQNIVTIEEFSIGIMNRFKDTGIVTKQIALTHSGLGLVAKASGVTKDNRIFDEDYQKYNIKLEINLGFNGDAADRFAVRAQEIFQSINIIKELLITLSHLKTPDKKYFQNDQPLKDGYYVSRIEGHRGENLQLMYVKESKIQYYKFKDPSFINWTLLEYSVLNNIIADFPICNKSFDLSYSGFDL